MIEVYVLIPLAWVIAKTGYFYVRSKKKDDLPTLVIAILLSYGVIWMGIYMLQFSYDTFMSIVSIEIKPMTFLFYTSPFVMDFLSHLIVKREKFAKDMYGLLTFELARGFIFMFLMAAVSLLFSLAFFLILFLANVFGWRINGIQF